MGLFSGRLVRPARVFAALVVGLAAILFLPAPAHAAMATFVKESQWSTGYVGKVTVVNDGPTAIPSWRVTFDLSADTTISNVWSTQVIRDVNRYTFTSLPWNGGLAPGASTSFGFVATGTGVPMNCTVNSAPCNGAPPPLDVRPPTKPSNIRVTALGMTSILWDASTDDRGVVAYEVFSNGTRVATTTNTFYTMPTPPPMIFTYGIRALDAAGNASPFAIAYFGTPTDTGPPTAVTNLRFTSLGQTHLGVAWDAARDDVFVAGYELYLNDVLVTTLSGTNSYVPYRGYGIYWVGVRAFDHAGKFSPMTRYGIAIDPPPPTTPPATP
jgi:hypothetical protein